MTEIPAGWIVRVRPYTRAPGILERKFNKYAMSVTLWEFEAERYSAADGPKWIGKGFESRSDAIEAAVDRIETLGPKEEKWEVLRGTRPAPSASAAPKREDGFK